MELPCGPVAETVCSRGSGWGSIPGRAAGSHMPQLGVHRQQLKVPYATTKIEGSACCEDPVQPNKCVFFFLKRISVRMGWNEKYEKKIQTPLHCMLTESPLLKNYSIAQTFPGHEMMIVTLFKNQILNVEFCAYLWLQRREVGQK